MHAAARGKSDVGTRWEMAIKLSAGGIQRPDNVGTPSLALRAGELEKLGGFSTIEADRLPGSCRVRTRDPRWQLNHGHPSTPVSSFPRRCSAIKRGNTLDFRPRDAARLATPRPSRPDLS